MEVLILVLLAGLTTCSIPAFAADVLYVGGSGNPTGEPVLRAHVQNIPGFNVTIKLDSEVQVSDADDVDLIFVSESIESGVVAGLFKDVAKPMVICEPKIYDDMQMADGGAGGENTYYGYHPASTTDIIIQKLDHPIVQAAGFSGSATVTVYTANSSISWGIPNNPETNGIATPSDDTSRYALFAYDAGDAMFGMNAPARRVGVWPCFNASANMTEDGWTLLDAAIDWAYPPGPTPTPTDTPLVAGTQRWQDYR